MKRRAIALGASVLLLGLLPGSVLAIPPSNLDQMNLPASTSHVANGGNLLAQTFTVGRSGLLVQVDLYLLVRAATEADIDIYAANPSTGFPTGSSLATGSAIVSSGAASYVSFAFFPFSVTAGTKYAIVLATNDDIGAIGSSDSYAGGEALKGSGGWVALSTVDSNLADLGFETFVDSVTPTLKWDKASVQAGTSTALTLKETVTFKNGSAVGWYDAHLTSALPGWFHTTGITCSDTAAGIATADCTLANFKGGFGHAIHASGAGDVVTITLAGTANPSAADVGATSVSAEGCLLYVVAGGPQPDGNCASTATRITVTAPAATPTPTTAPTPPPTSTGSGSSSDGSGVLWFLPIGLIGALAGLLALATRRRRIA